MKQLLIRFLFGLVLFSAFCSALCSAVIAAQPVPESGQPPENPALTRLGEIYTRLSELGISVNQGHVAERPMLINGKPVIALVVADWHNADYAARARVLIPKLAEEFKIPTLLLEGESADPQSEKNAKKLALSFETRASAQILSAEARHQFGVTDTAEGPDGYQNTDYKSLITSDRPFPRRSEGLESRNPEDIYFQLLRLYHQTNVEMFAADLKAEGGSCVIAIDGRPISESRAVFCAAQRELSQRYGSDFPNFIIPLDVANGTVSTATDSKPATVLTTADHGKMMSDYRKRSDSFFVKHDLRPRNVAMAHRVADFFQNQGERKDNTGEDIVLVVVGAAHLLSMNEVPANPPSMLDILEGLGISSAPIFALQPDEGLQSSIDPESGAVICNIVKKEKLEPTK